MAWHGIAWHGMAWHSLVCHRIAWHDMAQHGMAWQQYGMVWHSGGMAAARHGGGTSGSGMLEGRVTVVLLTMRPSTPCAAHDVKA